MRAIFGLQRAKHVIDGIKEDAAHVLATGHRTLTNAEEIVDKNVKGAKNGASPSGVQKGVSLGRGCCGVETWESDGCGKWCAWGGQGVGIKLEAVQGFMAACGEALVSDVGNGFGD